MVRGTLFSTTRGKGIVERLEDVDILSYLPKPLRLVAEGFKSEISNAIRQIILRLDLVTKEDYMVQKRLLQDALREVRELKEQLDEKNIS